MYHIHTHHTSHMHTTHTTHTYTSHTCHTHIPHTHITCHTQSTHTDHTHITHIHHTYTTHTPHITHTSHMHTHRSLYACFLCLPRPESTLLRPFGWNLCWCPGLPCSVVKVETSQIWPLDMCLTGHSLQHSLGESTCLS